MIQNDTMIQWYSYTKMIQWYNDAMIQKWYNSTMIQWYKRKHSVQPSVKQPAYNRKNKSTQWAVLSQTVRPILQEWRNNDAALSQTSSINANLCVAITIPVWQTSHPGIVSNNPSILQDGLGPNCGESGWFGRTFPDLVRFEGRRVSGLTGPTLCGRVSQTWRQYDKEQGIRKLKWHPKVRLL